MRKAVGSKEVTRRVRREVRERVLTIDPVVDEGAHAPRAERDGTGHGGPHEDEADVRMLT